MLHTHTVCDISYETLQLIYEEMEADVLVTAWGYGTSVILNQRNFF